LTECIFDRLAARFVVAIARDFFTFAENISLVLVLAITFSLSADLILPAERIAVRVAVAGEVVLVMSRFALAFVEEARLVAAAFFLAALALVACSEEGIDAAVADVTAVGVETDTVGITSMRFLVALVDILAFKRFRTCNRAVASFANACSVNISLFFRANLLAILSTALVALFAEALVAAFRISADSIFIAIIKLVAAFVSITAGFAGSVVTGETLAFKRNSVGYNILVDTLCVFAAHVLLLALVYISAGNLTVGKLNRRAARSAEALIATFEVHTVHVVSAADRAAFINVGANAVYQLEAISTGANAGVRTVANQDTNFTVETAWLANSNCRLTLCIAVTFRSWRTVAFVQLLIGIRYVVTERTWVTEVDHSASWIFSAVDSRARIASFASANKRAF
jgi:hypothetical protein